MPQPISSTFAPSAGRKLRDHAVPAEQIVTPRRRRRCGVAGDTSGSCGASHRRPRGIFADLGRIRRHSLRLISQVFVPSLRCSRDRDVTERLVASTSRRKPLSQNCSARAIPCRIVDSRQDEHATDRGRGAQQPDTKKRRPFGTGSSHSGFVAWSTPRSGRIPEADLAALQLPLGSTIVTISSGGCNALSYLTAQPAQVYAVDLNEAHLSLLKLKLAGIRAFSKYADFWQFFGEAASPANAQLYRERLRPLLGRGSARLLGQAQHHRASAVCLFHRRLLPPRHARPLHRSGTSGGETCPRSILRRC